MVEKRYNSFADYYRRRYGERLQKLVVDAGFTCPNRDGTVGRGGCTYCDNAAFHPGYSTPSMPISQQLDEGITFHKVRYRNAGHYLAYFQSFSNTYAPLPVLKERYFKALEHPEVAGIVIGTRPDCVDDAKLDFLADLAAGRALPGWRRTLAGGEITAPIVVVEYGIESCYDKTLELINRGHNFACAATAVQATAARSLDVGAHFILGLPGETRQMLLDQCAVINELPLTSVKFHQLQYVKGTPMEALHDAHPEEFLDLDLPDYLDLAIDILERLRPYLYIERIAGEVPPRFVRESRWGLIRNFEVLRLLDSRLKERNTYQGRFLDYARNDKKGRSK
ncbi:MAG: TIGR01212 family radical SAM protein [Bacteroidales bacterium]|nr:TIGR01212 family radical SAM protein [Bacteroidales bacterium]